MRYVGIDLAWSEGRPSGVVVLDDQGHVEGSAYLVGLDGIAGFAMARIGDETTLVAVDAPLRVRNLTGQREAEKALMRLFGSRHLGAHAANRRRLTAVHGGVRGEKLVELLSTTLRDPRAGRRGLDRGTPGAALSDRLIEVYPHSALMAWFDLRSPLPYKRGTVAERRDNLRRLLDMLSQLDRADPPLRVERAPWVPQADEWGTMSGGELAQLESLLDALVCAQAGRYWQRWGEARSARLGSPDEGQIVTPLPPSRWRAREPAAS